MNRKLVFESGEFNNQKVTALDAKPYQHEAVDEPPIILEPGWAARIEMFDEYVRKLQESGRRVIGVNAPHGIDTTDERFTQYAEVERRKAAAIHGILKENRFRIVNTVAHSQGALTSSAAVEADPQKFRNMVLVNPAGMIGPDTIPRLITRFGTDALVQLEQLIKDPRQLWRLNYLSSGAIASDIPRSWNEVRTLAGSDIAGRLRSIREQINGIGVIHSSGDRAFPIDRIREQGSKAGIDVFHEVSGTHNAMMFAQDEFADMTIETLRELETK